MRAESSQPSSPLPDDFRLDALFDSSAKPSTSPLIPHRLHGPCDEHLNSPFYVTFGREYVISGGRLSTIWMQQTALSPTHPGFRRLTDLPFSSASYKEPHRNMVPFGAVFSLFRFEPDNDSLLLHHPLPFEITEHYAVSISSPNHAPKRRRNFGIFSPCKYSVLAALRASSQQLSLRLHACIGRREVW